MGRSFLIALLLLHINAVTPSIADDAPHQNERVWMQAEAVFGGQVLLKTAGDPTHPAVVLIHGLGDEASRSWDDLIERLKNDYFIFTLDLPGFGRSSKLNALYSPRNYARLIRLLSAKILNRPFHLVGHSMGGAIALQYTHDYPSDVTTLTLIDAAGILHRLAYTKYLAPLGIDKLLDDYNFLSSRLVTDFAGTVLSELEKKTPIDMNYLLNFHLFRESVLQSDPGMIAGLALVMNDYSRVPETIHQPTLIVWGDQDRVAPLRTGEVLRALMPNARLALLPGGGHMAFVEQADRFNRLLLEHLQRKQPTADRAPLSGEYRETVTCRKQRGVTISGRIGRLVVEGCHDLLVTDAEINSVAVTGSSLTLLRTKITSVDTAMIIRDSNLITTVGKIEGKTAVESYNSRLDIAGTQLIGYQNAVKAPIASTIIFSMVPIESPNYKDRVIHGMEIVAPGKRL